MKLGELKRLVDAWEHSAELKDTELILYDSRGNEMGVSGVEVMIEYASYNSEKCDKIIFTEG